MAVIEPVPAVETHVSLAVSPLAVSVPSAFIRFGCVGVHTSWNAPLASTLMVWPLSPRLMFSPQAAGCGRGVRATSHAGVADLGPGRPAKPPQLDIATAQR